MLRRTTRSKKRDPFNFFKTNCFLGSDERPYFSLRIVAESHDPNVFAAGQFNLALNNEATINIQGKRITQH